MNLRECFDAHGCDKGKRHRYDVFYEPVFSPHRYGSVRILEIGVFGGASLAAWLDYFPVADVIGVDTFQRIPPDQIPILNHPRVSWWKLDSTQAVPDIEKVDFVIDDGSHEISAQVATFHLYKPLLKEGGGYFIEDVRDRREFTQRIGRQDLRFHRGTAGEYLFKVRP
jgi:hypothetical protein